MNQLSWMAHAWAELGVAEVPGSGTNPRVAAYFREVGSPAIRDDSVPWCAAFVGACLERAGIRSTRSLAARSYLGWGKPAEVPSPGVICVLARGSDPAAGHVGFLIGATERRVILLGGNQGDAVTVAAFDRARVLGYRLPVAAGDTGSAGSSGGERDPAPAFDSETMGTDATEDVFNEALAMVLRFEGGWSDDPYDPGGPTNKGITLATYAREKGTPLDDATRPRLVAELRRIPDALVRRIYRERYWRPACCPHLPPPLAVFHFDTAVNMGVRAAARLLQSALAVAVDGEIGPITLAAAQAADPRAVLGRYADLRGTRYRSLAPFWRFGRGWLARNDRALAQALGRARGEPILESPSLTKGKPMPSAEQPSFDKSPGSVPGKWWGQSLTIWGALVTGLSTVAPAVISALGFDLSVELAQRLSQDVVASAQALGGLVGTIMTIAGRLRASTRIERRAMALRI
jgi:uncharacterized protein (TIGR02594 family)